MSQLGQESLPSAGKSKFDKLAWSDFVQHVLLLTIKAYQAMCQDRIAQSDWAGIDVPDVRSEVRTGDTTQNKRAEMARRPPHILITTPESLYIILSTTKFREAFRRLKYVDVNSENLSYPEAGIIPSKYISRYAGKISLNNKRQIQSNGKISSFCEMARMPFLSKSWETKGGMPFKAAASYFIAR